MNYLNHFIEILKITKMFVYSGLFLAVLSYFTGNFYMLVFGLSSTIILPISLTLMMMFFNTFMTMIESVYNKVKIDPKREKYLVSLLNKKKLFQFYFRLRIYQFIDSFK